VDILYVTEVLYTSQAPLWHLYLNQLEQADIYFTPDYCRIYEENGEGTAQLFIYKEKEHFVYYPFLLRSINELPMFHDKLKEEWYDIVTPYGYGGPISNVTEQSQRKPLFERFGAVFSDYCQTHRIVTEFVRFHPLLQNSEDYTALERTFSRETALIDLTQSEDEIFRNYSKKTRNRIRKAEKEGLKVCRAGPEGMGKFIELYDLTMRKNQASSYYFFSDRFIQNTKDYLADHVELLEVKLGNSVLCSTFIMIYNRFAHYHLTGSDQQFLGLSPYNLLIHHAAISAKAKGVEYLHLGGGYNGNDELYRFKKGFSPHTCGQYYVGKKIHCPELYSYLIEQHHPAATSDYFPAYRHPFNGIENYVKNIKAQPVLS
jgi:hypothetical protein